MRVTIHQPEHIPWLGFFHKIIKADQIILLDNVQFRKNYYQNRNKIRTADGWTWITVPVKHDSETLIKDVTIASDKRWRKKWIDSIYFSYKKAKYFDNYSEGLIGIINDHSCNLTNLNTSLIKILCKFLKIEVDFVLASTLGVEGKGKGKGKDKGKDKGSDLILNICRKTDAKVYHSGISGKDYLKTEDFADNGIKVIFQEFHHPIYKQQYEPFVSCMSIIDLLFNHGDKSLNVINGIGVDVMEEVFF